PPAPSDPPTPSRSVSSPGLKAHNPWAEGRPNIQERPFGDTPVGTARPDGSRRVASVPALSLSPDPEDPTPQLTLPFPDAESFLDAYMQEGPLGGVVLDARTNVPLGQEVKLLLRFRQGVIKEFDIRGRVAWRRMKGSGNLRPGVGVEFLPSERGAVDRLLWLARGHSPSAADRKHRRIETQLQVKVAPRNGERRRCKAMDISEGGIFVASAVLLPLNEEVTVTLKAPGKLLGGFDVKGRVAWHREEGDRGYGVMFTFEGDDVEARVRELVARIRSDG
ncbi:MAG: PilZ domain-containing protein, partial [Myxococcota bacterium]